MGEKKQMGTLLFLFLLFRFLVKAFLEYLGSWFARPKYNHFLSKNFEPILDEIQKSDLEIIGKVPEDLNGQYVRNGPNPQLKLNGRPYHWFDGDGMLHGVEIMNGKASFINRWVRTEKWKKEKKTGKPILLGIGELNTRLGFLKMVLVVIIERIKNKGKKVFGRDGGTANTALVYHDGRLLALVESSLPTHVKAPNFETIGVYDYDGKLNHNVTAHPKVDHQTGEFFFFGYSFQKPFLNYSYVSKEGKLINSFAIDKPNATMIHDFAVTKKYSIFPDLPLVFRMENILLDKPLIQFEPQTESRFGILPRTAKDQSEIKWFKALPGYFFHSVNAWEEGEEVVLVACRSEKIDLSLSTNEKGEYITKYPPKLYEWRFNMGTGQTKEKLLVDNILSEFPMINPRFAMRKNRYMYSAILITTSPEAEGILKYDYETGEVIQLRFGRNKYGGEPFFVERKGSSDEDDGYLLVIVWDYSTKTTEFWIIDAKTMSASPIARIKLPQRVPYGFHGLWLSAEEIANQKKS